MMKISSAAFFLATIGGVALCHPAQGKALKDDGDHLEPGFSGEQILPDYEHAVADRLTGGAKHVILMVEYPSFKSENAVFISKDASDRREVTFAIFTARFGAM